MRCVFGSILFLTLSLVLAFAQVSPQPAYDSAQMERVLKEAGELQSTEPQSVPEKLAPVLAELRKLRENGMLDANASRTMKDALLLLMRTQTMLLAPEQEIVSLVRELLITDPKVDESIFNPREKVLLENLRSAEAGSLNLETIPPGVVLSYLGTDLGTTPGRFELIAGSYRFQLRLPGYLDQDVSVAIKPSEALILSRTMRRRAVDIPVAINAPSVSVTINGKASGSSLGYKAWMAALPSPQQPEYESIVRQWKVDQSGYSFFRLTEVPIDEALKIEFQAPCYQSLVLEIKVASQDVDWTRPLFVLPKLANVQLAKDTGSIDVSSTPSGAEVWVDGSLQGQSPLVGKELCSGTHRVQILHNSGQYVRDIVVQRGRAAVVRGRLRPALAFLGIYERDEKKDDWVNLDADSRSVAKSIVLNCRSFSDPLIAPEDIELLRRKGVLPVGNLLSGAESADLDRDIKTISAAVGRAELLLLGLRTGSGYIFRLYSTLHPTLDLIEVAGLDETALGFMISQLNKADRIQERLQLADLGIEMMDSPDGLVISKISPAVSARKTALALGMVVKSIDEKPLSFVDFQRYLRSKKPEQTIVLEVHAGKEKIALVPVTVRQSGAEYPWNTPDGFPNSVLTMLRHIVERDPLSDEAKLAALGLARGFMRQKQWKLALDYLAKANLDLHKSGICPGTVLYYQGRCYEEMGNRAQAESYYTRAKDYPEATLGTSSGLSIQLLAEQRLQVLRKR